MKYPFNKPPVIRRSLGTAADILLHSYAHPLSRIRGLLRENVRRMLGVERIRSYLSSHIRVFFLVRSPFVAYVHKLSFKWT